MYESTMDALMNLYDKVSDGGFIIVDDFGAVPRCQKAVLDFRNTRGIEAPIQPIDGRGVYWRKRKNGIVALPPAVAELAIQLS
jgi:Macrocin-O-methyltransferase (TylF)